jgi:myo-inositol-1(or 4)-monophosphatase
VLDISRGRSRVESDRELDELLTVARVAAAAGARRAIEWTRRRDVLTVEEKGGPGDLVSQADRDAEQAIRSSLRALRPADAWLGEESGHAPGRSGICWVVDPIDGTTEYIYGRAGWAVSVAAVREHDRRVLAGIVVEPALHRFTEARLGGGTWCSGRRLRCRTPTDLARALIEVNLGAGDQRRRAGRLMDELVPHVRDIRDGGSAASALAAVAGGRVDAYWGPGLHEWDAAAGLLLVNEAGGLTGDLGGDSEGAWPSDGDVLAANADLWSQLQSRLLAVYAGGTPPVT